MEAALGGTLVGAREPRAAASHSLLREQAWRLLCARGCLAPAARFGKSEK